MDVSSAIADPVRREILMLLRSGPMTAGEIARRFTVSRPAISRHLRVLRESGLARDEVVGRQRRYRLDTAPLAELRDWLDQFFLAATFEQHLDALETEVRRGRREREQRWTKRAGNPTGTGSRAERDQGTERAG